MLLNVVWVICHDGGRKFQRADAAALDMLMKLCYIPYYLLAALMVLAGFATFMFGGVLIIGVMDCGRPVFDTAVHLWTVRLHPGVQ